MRRHYETVWTFETANLRVLAEVTPCEEDPADSFEFPEDIEAVRSGHVEWFDARVRVLFKGENESDDIELGADYLGCCAYYKFEDLFRHHASLTQRLRTLRGRTDAKSRQERKGIKETLANNIQLAPPVTYCEYGPSMVLSACSEARKQLAKLQTIRVRESV